MDVKTLSAVIGHVSATTLNIYAHITNNMKKQAAEKIDKGIAGNDAAEAQHPPKRRYRPASSRPLRGSTASQARVVSPESMTTCGRGATPRSVQMAKSIPATSMPTARRRQP